VPGPICTQNQPLPGAIARRRRDKGHEQEAEGNALLATMTRGRPHDDVRGLGGLSSGLEGVRWRFLRESTKKMPGNDLLSRSTKDQYHRRGRLNGRVRDGNGCGPSALVTGQRRAMPCTTQLLRTDGDLEPRSSRSAPRGTGSFSINYSPWARDRDLSRAESKQAREYLCVSRFPAPVAQKGGCEVSSGAFAQGLPVQGNRLNEQKGVSGFNHYEMPDERSVCASFSAD
jgi:hypothetical protein